MSPQLVSLLAQIFAQQAIVVSMQADNMQRAVCGESMAWSSGDFAAPTDELARLAEYARLLSA